METIGHQTPWMGNNILLCLYVVAALGAVAHLLLIGVELWILAHLFHWL